MSNEGAPTDVSPVPLPPECRGQQRLMLGALGDLVLHLDGDVVEPSL
jgi:hypothetical protein